MHGPEAQWNPTLPVKHRNDSSSLIQPKGDFVLNISGTHRCWRQDHHNDRTPQQCLLDRLCPSSPRSNIQLVQPHRRTRRLQILGQPQRKFRILTRVADERGLWIGWQ